MKKEEVEIPFIIKQKIYFDSRGYFQELYQKKKIEFNSIFTAMSCSKKNVIRGLHYQIKKPQKKLVTILMGNAIDICVNIKKTSLNFGKVYKFFLYPGLSLYVPEGYAHGIGFYKKKNIFLYHLSEYRYKNFERGIAYNDKILNIDWGIKKPIISIRDQNHKSFLEI